MDPECIFIYNGSIMRAENLAKLSYDNDLPIEFQDV